MEAAMDLKTYFESNRGTGVMATADADGKVGAAIYSRPHFLDDGTIAFIMRDRLTHHNLQSNPHATYLFIENRPGYRGKRLFLTKTREEKGGETLSRLHRRSPRSEDTETEAEMFLVYFTLDKELPLIGSGGQ
jgi:hypothetical protein